MTLLLIGRTYLTAVGIRARPALSRVSMLSNMLIVPIAVMVRTLLMLDGRLRLDGGSVILVRVLDGRLLWLMRSVCSRLIQWDRTWSCCSILRVRLHHLARLLALMLVGLLMRSGTRSTILRRTRHTRGTVLLCRILLLPLLRLCLRLVPLSRLSISRASTRGSSLAHRSCWTVSIVVVARRLIRPRGGKRRSWTSGWWGLPMTLALLTWPCVGIAAHGRLPLSVKHLCHRQQRRDGQSKTWSLPLSTDENPRSAK